jgi:hypothetical protein
VAGFNQHNVVDLIENIKGAEKEQPKKEKEQQETEKAGR